MLFKAQQWNSFQSLSGSTFAPWAYICGVYCAFVYRATILIFFWWKRESSKICFNNIFHMYTKQMPFIFIYVCIYKCACGYGYVYTHINTLLYNVFTITFLIPLLQLYMQRKKKTSKFFLKQKLQDLQLTSWIPQPFTSILSY